MNSSKRQTTPWTKSHKKHGPKKEKKGEHFNESKKKELAASEKAVRKVPGLTSLQAMFLEFHKFHILQLPEKLVPVV